MWVHVCAWAGVQLGFGMCMYVFLYVCVSVWLCSCVSVSTCAVCVCVSVCVSTCVCFLYVCVCVSLSLAELVIDCVHVVIYKLRTATSALRHTRSLTFRPHSAPTWIDWQQHGAHISPLFAVTWTQPWNGRPTAPLPLNLWMLSSSSVQAVSSQQHSDPR